MTILDYRRPGQGGCCVIVQRSRITRIIGQVKICETGGMGVGGRQQQRTIHLSLFLLLLLFSSSFSFYLSILSFVIIIIVVVTIIIIIIIIFKQSFDRANKCLSARKGYDAPAVAIIPRWTLRSSKRK